MVVPAKDCIQHGGSGVPTCDTVDVQTNPFRILLDHIETLVRHMGPYGQDMMKDLSEGGQSNAEDMSKLENALRSQGDFDAAHRIAEYKCDVCKRARSHVTDMHHHIETIADVLSNLPDVREEPAATHAAFQTIMDVAHRAFTSTEYHNQALSNFTDELWHIGQGRVNMQREADEEAQKFNMCSISAALEAMIGFLTGTATAGSAGIGYLARIKGASWASRIPLAGEVLTTVTTRAAGGLRGVLGFRTTQLAFCPAGVAAGLSFVAVFGVLTSLQLLQVASEVRRRSLAREKKNQALKRLRQSKETVQMLEDVSHTMAQRIVHAEFHASLWWDIRISAQDAVHSLPASGGTLCHDLNSA